MKRIGLFSILSALILLGYIICVKVQYGMPVGYSNTAPVTVGTPTGVGTAPSYHISTPEQANIVAICHLQFT